MAGHFSVGKIHVFLTSQLHVKGLPASNKLTDDRRRKKLRHILSLLAENAALMVKIGSKFVHNSVEKVSKLSLLRSSFSRDNSINE